MKQNVAMLTITICGIDSKERSRIFRLVSEAAVVGSQVTYKTGNTIECSLPASESQQIPDEFFELISTHEGSSLKVENVLVSVTDSSSDENDDEEEEDDGNDDDDTDLEKKIQQYADFVAKEVEEDFKEDDSSNEEKKALEEDNAESSKDSDNISEISANQETQTDVKQKRGRVTLSDDFCDKEIEAVFEAVKRKQESVNPKSIGDSVLMLNELIDDLATLLDITDPQKEETFAKLMNLATKCERNNPGKPVTTRAMKKEKNDISPEEWTRVNTWLGERARRHDLTLSTLFEYLFRCVRKYGILLIDSDFVKDSSSNDVQTSKEQKEQPEISFEEANKVPSQQNVIPILLEDNEEEFMRNFRIVMNAPDFDESQKAKGVLALLGIEKPEAVRLVWQVLKRETPADLRDIAKDALISGDDYYSVNSYIYGCLENSKFVGRNVNVVMFLNYLSYLFKSYKDEA